MNIFEKIFMLLHRSLLRKRTIYILLIIFAFSLLGLISSGTLTLVLSLLTTSQRNLFANMIPGDLYDVVSFTALIMVMISLASYIMAKRRSLFIANSEVRHSPIPNRSMKQPLLAILPSSLEISNLSENSQGQSEIQEACFALAQGQPKIAIELAISVQSSNRAIWDSLLEAVARVPTKSVSIVDMKKEAFDSLMQAMKYSNEQDKGKVFKLYITSLVLYRWLLNSFDRDTPESAEIWQNMGIAYSSLLSGEPQIRLEDLTVAIACYQVALQIYETLHLKEQIATTYYQLGTIYEDMPNGDRHAYLEAAITSYRIALHNCTSKKQSYQRAKILFCLGKAYHLLPARDRKRQENLKKAITCYQDALPTYKESRYVDLKEECGEMLINLGDAYFELQQGNRQQNIMKAIGYYTDGSDFYRSDPIEYANTQSTLGDMYHVGSGVLQNINRTLFLKKAITYYQNALRIYKKENMNDEAHGLQIALDETIKELQSLDKR